MNNCILMGRLVKDVEVNYSKGDKPIAVGKFTLAVQRTIIKNKTTGNNSPAGNEADFINCICFGTTAETISKYFAKGSLILVTARVQTGSYEKDNKKIYTTDFVVDRFNFTGERKPEATEKTTTATEQYNAMSTAQFEEDIPF